MPAPLFDYDSYLSEVAALQQARPEALPGRVHYDVLVTVAPQVAFAITDSHDNPCFHQDRLPMFLSRVRAAAASSAVGSA